MEASYFEQSWHVVCFGGFLFGREALRRMVPNGGGTVLFTGASASVRGRAGFAAFNSAKAGLRILAQAMAKEYARDGIHIGHVIVDGAIGGEKIRKRFPDAASRFGEDGLISIEGIVDAFVFLHKQPRAAWSFEIDLRTSGGWQRARPPPADPSAGDGSIASRCDAPGHARFFARFAASEVRAR
jgi:NAD(P)-dependent dehydrogenase (short-subunit alcohol dehydrogenase family)